LFFKAVVVIVVCLLQSPKFRAKVFGAQGHARGAAPAPAAPAADAAPKTEVSR
jgi:simple sugar transport system permease protein